MQRRKLRVSIFTFLQTGRLGPYQVCRATTPEALIACLGEPDGIEVCALGRFGAPYVAGDARCFPVVVRYGTLEAHFDTPDTLCALYCDCFVRGLPRGGRLKLTDCALVRADRPLREVVALARRHGLTLTREAPEASRYAWQLNTAGGVALHFEHDEADADPQQATLRAWGWSHAFV